MFAKEKPRFLSAGWVLEAAWKSVLTSSVMFIVSGGYRDYLDREASRVSVEVAAPVPVRDLVESLTDEDRRQINCLARNAYFEAGNQGQEGMRAVGDVVFNRLGSGLYPGAICEVIYEGPRDTAGRLLRDRCQFSWACDGKDHDITSRPLWSVAYTVALKQYIYREKLPDLTGGATRYHANYVAPKWKSWRETIQIGAHLFYKPAKAPGAGS
jgi:spore germination cell wall hydrolase CwlJ-like protein